MQCMLEATNLKFSSKSIHNNAPSIAQVKLHIRLFSSFRLSLFSWREILWCLDGIEYTQHAHPVRFDRSSLSNHTHTTHAWCVAYTTLYIGNLCVHRCSPAYVTLTQCPCIVYCVCSVCDMRVSLSRTVLVICVASFTLRSSYHWSFTHTQTLNSQLSQPKGMREKMFGVWWREDRVITLAITW